MANQKDDSHDWLGDAAENLVRYHFSRAGYDVYGSSKWGADICVVGKPTQSGQDGPRVIFVEVKSTDSPKKSWQNIKNSRSVRKKVKGRKFNILVGVKFSLKGQAIRLWKLKDGKYEKKWHDELSPNDLGMWLRGNFSIKPHFK